MKETEFERKDGSSGMNYKCDVAGDEFVSKFAKVGSRDNAVIIDGKAKIIKNHFLQVNYNGKDIYLVITDGQKKVLDKAGDLTGKTLVTYKYSNTYGDQIGIKVKN